MAKKQEAEDPIPSATADGAPAEENKPVVPETVRHPFKQVLKCKLTDAETLAYAREAADASETVAQLQADMKSLATEYKGKIALKLARLATLNNYVATGHEHRDVECERVYDYGVKLVTDVRLDGQEPYVIEQRGLTNDELQRQLALIER